MHEGSPPGSRPPGPASFPSQPPPPPRRTPRPPAAPRRTNPLNTIILLLLGASLGGTCVTCATVGNTGANAQVFGGSGERVGVVELEGAIMDATDFVRDIRAFGRRDDLVAVVVRIDSPGGAVAPSQEIFEAMRAVSKKKPVVASMGNVAASGGFWASLGADWVFASPGSVTGSIGVITQTPDLTEIAQLLRFRMHTFKSGPLKDAGNPFREMTPADEALFQGLIADIYDQFVTAIAERRGLPIEKVKALADGRVMTGRAALDADLIDALGGLHDAARKAVILAKQREEKAAGETVTSSTAYQDMEEPTLVYPKRERPGLLDLLTQVSAEAIASGVEQGADRLLSRTRGPVELR
ncbi:MAG: signal peptide peptidase SppA [Deltaproteobacteria bacterium]